MGAETAKEGVILLKKNGIPQEGMKLIACLTMLIDHIGATLVPLTALRVVGRLAFPIYCFLFAEGMAHTRDVKKYGIRLAIGALLAEVPFDLALYGQLSWAHQSVMVTLLLGFVMTLWIRRAEGVPLVPVIVCAVAAEILCTDYGAGGIAMIALFVLSREHKDRLTIQVMGLGLICWLIGGAGWQVGQVFVPVQIVGVLALIPIGLYSGTKVTTSRAVQWAFYLFYPVHLALLWIMQIL